MYGFVNGFGDRIFSHSLETATNFVGNYAVVQRDGQLEVINRSGARQAVADFTVAHAAHFDGSMFVVRREDTGMYSIANWQGGSLTINLTDNEFEYLGRLANGLRVVGQNGMWGLHDTSGRTPGIPFEFVYYGIAMDEFGRAAVNERVFVQHTQDGQFYMLDTSANQVGQPFDDARPFFEAGGLAAVMRGNKWGFVDLYGNMVIDFIFDEADSSSMSLAPVMVDGLCGFITVEDFSEEYREQFFGQMVIEPQFLDAKQFVSGTAPVMSERGWFYITLIAFM